MVWAGVFRGVSGSGTGKTKTVKNAPFHRQQEGSLFKGRVTKHVVVLLNAVLKCDPVLSRNLYPC